MTRADFEWLDVDLEPSSILFESEIFGGCLILVAGIVMS